MKASVVIPAYNASATLPSVLQALTRQSHVDFEVILVDDASTDDTILLAKSFRQMPLRIIANAENQGRARSRNIGVESASGEIILLLDSDIVVNPEYVAAHLSLHKRLSRAVGIGALRYPPHLARKALARYNAARGGIKIGPDRSLPGNYLISGLASFPRSLFVEVGGFNPIFHHYGGEDQELGLRLKKAGADFRYLPQAIGYHHHLRSLKELTLLLEGYGRECVPLILERHPEFARELFLEDLTDPPATPLAIRVLRRALSSDLFYHPLKEFARLLENHPLPAPLLTYLIYRSYRQGYARHLEGQQTGVGLEGNDILD